jgi:hypothetical protein
MTFLQTQFDKLLMAALVLAMCGLALLTNEKLTAFALQAAGGCMGCLLTLVTARGRPPADPTSLVTSARPTTEEKC